MNSLILKLKKIAKRNVVVKETTLKILSIFRRYSERKMTDYINRNYKHLCEKYNNFAEVHSLSTETYMTGGGGYPVWVCWFQGRENMPETIKMCHDSLIKNKDGHKINLITSNNWSDFVDIPEYIRKKYEKGMIMPTHFSEILRANLLSRYGGLWLDASIYVSDRLPSFENFSYYTTIMKRNDGRHTYSEFLAFCLPNNILWSSVKDFLFDYWRKNDKAIDYFILSIFMDYAYKNINAIKLLIDNVPLSRRSVFDLYCVLNHEYNASEYKTLCEAISFHKLTYKEDFKSYTKDKKLTYYGYLYQEWEKDLAAKNEEPD